MTNLNDIIYERVTEANAATLAFLVSTGAYDSEFHDPEISEVEDNEAIDEDGYVAPIVFDMVYDGGTGAGQRRRVRLLSIRNGPTDTTFLTYCYMREKERRFKLSAVREIIDISTGEVFGIPRNFFIDCGILSALTPEASAIITCGHELAILAFLGGCDGRFVPAEHDEIVKHVFDQVCAPLDETIIRNRIALIAPDEKAFKKALKVVRLDESRKRGLIRSIRRVIDADGYLHENEILVGAQILKALGVQA